MQLRNNQIQQEKAVMNLFSQMTPKNDELLQSILISYFFKLFENSNYNFRFTSESINESNNVSSY